VTPALPGIIKRPSHLCLSVSICGLI
jgi:hypothetical protein